MIFNLVWLPARQTGSSTRTKVLLRIMLRDTTVCEDDLVKQALNDAEVLGIGSRISLIRDPALDWKLELPPGRIEIVARDGRRWLGEGRNVPGNADNPMSWTDIGAKFRECGSVAVTPVPNKVLARAEDLARRLETLD